MRYEIYVNGRLEMMVPFIANARHFIDNQRSYGRKVVVRDMKTGKEYASETADEIAADAYKVTAT